MKVKIYFYKHGFQTDGVSLWVVQCGRQKWFAEQIVIRDRTVISQFQNKNPHAFLEIVDANVFAYTAVKRMQWMNTKQKVTAYRQITISK